MIYVHNIIAIAGLAIRVSIAYKDAPEAYRHISEEVAALKLLVDKVAPRFQGTTLSQEDYYYGEMVFRDCQSVLEDLDSFIRKYHRLASINKRFVLNRLKLGKEDITALSVRLVSKTVLFNGFVRSCEYNETKAQLTALLGLHGTARTRISITSITAFAANSNTNTETAYKQFQEDLCQRGVPENLIQEKEDKIREILKSQGMVARRQIVSSDTGAKDQVLETAYETYCKHLYELGFTKELIPPKAWVLKTLKSQGVASSQSSDKDKDSTKVLPSFRLSSRVNWFESSAEAGTLVPEATSDDSSPPLQISASNSHVGIVELLFGKASSTKIIDQDNTTLLHLAAGGGCTGLMVLLLDKNSLNLATVKGHPSVLELLFGKGASIEVKDKDNNTPLHLGAWKGHTGIVEILLERGASVEAISRYYNHPLHLAAKEGHTEIVELLLKHGASIQAIGENLSTPLHLAAWEGHTATVELLLEKGALIEALDEEKNTPLHLASSKGHTGLVDFFLRKGTSIAAIGQLGRTPLHFAALGGHTGTVELLLEKGASIDALNTNNNTPLHFAAQDGYTETVELLLKKGASIDPIGQFNRTPLHCAAWGGRTRTVELLLEEGASTEARNDSNKTPLDVATERGHTDTVQLLKNKAAQLAHGNGA